MVILKTLSKLMLIPILLFIRIIRLALNTAAKIYCLVAVWLWMLLAVCAVVTALNQKFEQTFLLGIVGVVTFGVLFGGLMIEALLKELGDCLKKI